MTDPTSNAPTPGSGLRISNEFALIELSVDEAANGSRLRISSGRTGRSALLDPMALEVLTWLPVSEIIKHLSTPFGPEEADLTPAGFLAAREAEGEPRGTAGGPEDGPAVPGRA